MPQQETTPSPAASDEDNDNFHGLYYRVDIEALNYWGTVTKFMKGSIGIVDQDPKITDDFKQFDKIVWFQLGEKSPGLPNHDNRTVTSTDYWT